MFDNFSVIEKDCDACVSELAANGGCGVSELILEGCTSCHDQMNEYCKSILGKLLL